MLETYLPSATVATCDGSPLTRGSSLVDYLRRRRWLGVYISGSVRTRRRRQTVWILRGLDMGVHSSHV